MTSRRVTLQIAGPATRSTVGEELVDRRQEALDDLLHWIWSWRLQCRRLGFSTAEQGSGTSDLDRRRSSSAASFDQHVVAVVGRNLVIAEELAGKEFSQLRTLGKQGKALQLLRNLYEHWDEQRAAFRSADQPKERAGKEFAEEYPGRQPWSIVYDENDWLLGGVVGLNTVTAELEGLERRVLELEATLQSPQTKK